MSKEGKVLVKVMQIISVMIDSFTAFQGIEFYPWLASQPFPQGTSTTERQMQQEIVKARLICKEEENWESEIIKAEQNPWLKGDLRFLLPDNEETFFPEFQKNLKTTFDIFPEDMNKKVDYLWVRAMLACSDEIDLDQSLNLSDKPFDNWRALINNRCMDAFRKLLEACKGKDTREAMNEICDNYQRSNSMAWIYPLVKKIPNSEKTLLDDYSESRKIQKYDYYREDPIKRVYLYNKNIWTESNIILTPYRNEIIQELLKIEPMLSLSDSDKNISNCYFRGWDIVLNQITNGIRFEYFFTRDSLIVGIREEFQGFAELFQNEIDVANKEDWALCSEFKFADEVINDDCISPFLKKVQNWKSVKSEKIQSWLNCRGQKIILHQ